MTMVDIILKKKRGEALTDDELRFWINGVVDRSVSDYHSAALLMAICFQGLSEHETATLTEAMMRSGDVADLSDIDGFTVDKHSTGGVGDKTTLVVAPLAAACGLKVAKMSGRGLGHTGGTIDKLESIDGFQTTLSAQRFTQIVKEHGLCVIAQSGDIAPADKALYALRDVTGTVDNLSLIASSIMSKKLASGAKALVLDVKAGSGAFMKTAEDAIALAKAMVDIGTRHGREVTALITDMDRPLGFAVGNALEVREAINTLKGNGPADLTELSLSIVTAMLTMAGHGSEADCRKEAETALSSGNALKKLRAMIRAQGGDDAVIDNDDLLCPAPYSLAVTAPENGYIVKTDTEAIGRVCTLLGAGRTKKDDPIDMGAGLILHKKTGDAVCAGETLAVLYASEEHLLTVARDAFLSAVRIGVQSPSTPPIILKTVTAKDI
ncbi:MAG: thymidine phosphorylase [Ruminococcaceae bacterium]|nr:thymidine phosphorylase [Oscillospiraceae bacterium]